MCVECLKTIKSMVVLLGVDATLSDGCGIWQHLHNFMEVNGYMKVYDSLFPLVVEHSVVVMSTRLNPMCSQFSIHISYYSNFI